MTKAKLPSGSSSKNRPPATRCGFVSSKAFAASLDGKPRTRARGIGRFALLSLMARTIACGTADGREA